MRTDGLTDEFLLVAGASRERQFDDFWKVKITLGKEGFTHTYQKLQVTERDGFSARNGLTAALSPSENIVYLFGGQDSERDEQFDEIYMFDTTLLTLKQLELSHDKLVPAKRNSHTMVST